MRYCLIVTHWKIKEDTELLCLECKKYMDKVIYLVDEKQKEIEWFEYKQYPNEWRDFWKIYRRLKETELTNEDELLITNDTISPIWSFKKLFKHCQNKKYQFTGATSAYTEYVMSKIIDWRHIQSFFIYFKWDAILSYKEYFMKQGIIKGKREWVETFEMWVPLYMKLLWYKCKAFIEADYMMKKYDQCKYEPRVFIKTKQKLIEYKEDWERNWTFAYPERYIEEWLPFVKNTMLKYGFDCPIIQVLSSKIYKKWKN